MFGPLDRPQTVPEQVAGVLRKMILGDELGVGERLPSEKAMAEQFGTNRVSLRQALQILKASGLIEGGQGKAWRVADFRQRGGLEWLPELFEVHGFTAETIHIIEDFLQVRTPVLQQVLQAAMQRMSEAQGRVLVEALEELEALVKEGASTAAIFAADLAWFEALLQASNSLLFRSVYNPFADVYRRFSSAIVLVWVPPEGYPTQLREIQDAIQAGDVGKAGTCLAQYLEAEKARLREFLPEIGEERA